MTARTLLRLEIVELDTELPRIEIRQEPHWWSHLKPADREKVRVILMQLGNSALFWDAVPMIVPFPEGG